MYVVVWFGNIFRARRHKIKGPKEGNVCECVCLKSIKMGDEVDKFWCKKAEKEKFGQAVN